jgi:hypothetical protein
MLCLLISSCGTFQGAAKRIPASADTSCRDLVTPFLKLKSEDLMGMEISSLVKLDLTKEEISDFFKYFSDRNVLARDEDTLRAIFLYAKEDSLVRQTLFKEYNSQLSGSSIDETNKIWEKFIYHKKRVDLKKEKMIQKETASGAKQSAFAKSLIYEKLYYSCKTQIKGTPTSSALKQAKYLTYALSAGGLGATTISYTGVHWEEEKNKKWFNELYFTLGIGLVFTFIGGKLVLANPKLNPWTGKMPLAFLNNALSDIGVSGAYAYFFRTKDSELESKLKELETDPDAQKKLQELLKIAEENHLFEKHLKKSQNLFKDKRTGESMNSKDFNREITIDDVDLEESRELLLAALAEQEYQENSGLLKTGNPAVDRFTYHRIFNLFSVPTNIGLTILMQNQ